MRNNVNAFPSGVSQFFGVNINVYMGLKMFFMGWLIMEHQFVIIKKYVSIQGVLTIV
jgi:hypothetical protein